MRSNLDQVLRYLGLHAPAVLAQAASLPALRVTFTPPFVSFLSLASSSKRRIVGSGHVQAPLLEHLTSVSE